MSRPGECAKQNKWRMYSSCLSSLSMRKEQLSPDGCWQNLEMMSVTSLSQVAGATREVQLAHAGHKAASKVGLRGGGQVTQRCSSGPSLFLILCPEW